MPRQTLVSRAGGVSGDNSLIQMAYLPIPISRIVRMTLLESTRYSPAPNGVHGTKLLLPPYPLHVKLSWAGPTEPGWKLMVG